MLKVYKNSYRGDTMELTFESIDKEIKRKFINKLNRNCKNGLVKLEESNVKHRETLSLLNQSYNTIRNAEMNLKNIILLMLIHC